MQDFVQSVEAIDEEIGPKMQAAILDFVERVSTTLNATKMLLQGPYKILDKGEGNKFPLTAEEIKEDPEKFQEEAVVLSQAANEEAESALWITKAFKWIGEKFGTTGSWLLGLGTGGGVLATGLAAFNKYRGVAKGLVHSLGFGEAADKFISRSNVPDFLKEEWKAEKATLVEKQSLANVNRVINKRRHDALRVIFKNDTTRPRTSREERMTMDVPKEIPTEVHKDEASA